MHFAYLLRFWLCQFLSGCAFLLFPCHFVHSFSVLSFIVAHSAEKQKCASCFSNLHTLFYKLVSQKTIDDYTERQYNNCGWAIVHSVLSGKEQTKLFSQFADKETLDSKYLKSFDDYYMIPVGEHYSYNDKIVFIDGTNQHPIIDRIVKVNGEMRQLLAFACKR